jgi:UDP-sugar transporter A1/2/3
LTKIGDFWASQVCLYAFGLFFAVVAYPLVFVLKPDTSAVELPEDSLTVLVLLIVITAITGLVVAVVLRARDNILKIIGIAASLVTIAISQFILLPELRSLTFTVWKVGGGGVVCISTWTYNYYSKEAWPSSGHVYLPVVERSDEDATNEGIAQDVIEKPGSGLFVPDTTKILCCSIVVVFCTVEVAWKAVEKS